MQALREVYALLAEDASQEAVSPAGEWLLDNFHTVTAAARDIHHDLPPSFFKRLPRVAADEFAGLPRIYALALELIGSSAGRLDALRLQRFIGAFQSITPLTIGELWAWPSVLKLALRSITSASGPMCWRRRGRIVWRQTGWPRRSNRCRTLSATGRPRCTRRSSATLEAVARPRRDRIGAAPPARRGVLSVRGETMGKTRSASMGSTRPPSRRAWPA